MVVRHGVHKMALGHDKDLHSRGNFDMCCKVVVRRKRKKERDGEMWWVCVFREIDEEKGDWRFSLHTGLESGYIYMCMSGIYIYIYVYVRHIYIYICKDEVNRATLSFGDFAGFKTVLSIYTPPLNIDGQTPLFYIQ